MAYVEFQYDGNKTTIQCQTDQKMFEICNNFLSKSNIKENEIYYFYNGKAISQINKNMTFYQMANSLDKTRKKMNILVINNEKINEKNIMIKSKNIICPECGEDIKMKINNYKINLFECKNNHRLNNMLLDEFENTQMINLMNIKCDICKDNNKYNAYNNEFYKCYECNKNICPLCKLKHDNAHNVNNYDEINYICCKHDEKLSNYCNDCKKNICLLCEKDHLLHNKTSFINLIFEKKELFSKLDDLNKNINIFNEYINKIIEIIKSVKIYINNYYKFEEYIINNYNEKKRNYEILYNINEIINNNKNIINDINELVNNNNISKLFNIYKKLYNNEIKLIIKAHKKDINNKIYFLDNTDDKYNTDVEIKDANKKNKFDINYIKEEHHHDLLKELNDSNVELYINNKKYKYEKYFIPDKRGEYNILLKFNIQMTDCSFMFADCKNIINLDLSSFNTQNVTNMHCMFFGCSDLENINLSGFNTQNVTNMMYMFGKCPKLKQVDLSSFNTQKVTNMYCMFDGCSSLTNLDLSSFNTQNVTNMLGTFSGCSNLNTLDLSFFNTKNVTNMMGMFGGCSKLSNINLSSFNTQNVKNMIYMFYGCSSLEKIDISSFDTQKINDMAGMFDGCSKLKDIKLK